MILKTLFSNFCGKFTETFKNMNHWFAPEEELPLYKLVVINRVNKKSTTTYFNTMKEAVDSIYPKYLYDTKCDYMVFDNTKSKKASYINLKTNSHGSNTNRNFQSRFANNKNLYSTRMEGITSC